MAARRVTHMQNPMDAAEALRGSMPRELSNAIAKCMYKKKAGGDPRGLQAEITKFSDFERLEAKVREGKRSSRREL